MRLLSSRALLGALIALGLLVTPGRRGDHRPRAASPVVEAVTHGPVRRDGSTTTTARRTGEPSFPARKTAAQ